MATIIYKGVSGVRATLTVNTTDTLTTITNAAIADEGLNANYYADFVLDGNNAITRTDNGSSTYADLGLTADSMLVAVLDDDPATWTKQQRQVRKLEIASIKREADGKTNFVYDLTALPDTYNNNDYTPDDNPNPDGLLLKRPWVTVGAVAAPESIAESVGSDTLVDLQVWYDGADNYSYVPSPSDEGNITQWTDKSAFAHNANPTGGNAKPTYESSDPLNGLSYVEFDGTEAFSVNPVVWTQGVTGFTAIMLVKPYSQTSGDTIITTNTGDFNVAYNGSSWTVGMNTGTATPTSAVTMTDWTVVTFVYDGASSLIFRTNKTTRALGAYTTPAASSASNTHLYFGHDGSSTAYTGAMAEIIMFDKALTATEYANIENYLYTKWGL